MRGERPTDNPAGEASAIVYGTYGTFLTSGRLAIGDYGKMALHGGNIFMGEYGTNIDSDIMQLHGKLGMYFTRDYGEIVAYYKYSEGNKFNFNCDEYANGIKLTSDERLKNNINKLNKTLPLLRKLEGAIYNMTGTLLKTITINQRGNGNEKINANEFVAGMYLYSLVCDGKIVDTKQMLLTN